VASPFRAVIGCVDGSEGIYSGANHVQPGVFSCRLSSGVSEFGLVQSRGVDCRSGGAVDSVGLSGK
jgi:hypothetical protein